MKESAETLIFYTDERNDTLWHKIFTQPGFRHCSALRFQPENPEEVIWFDYAAEGTIIETLSIDVGFRMVDLATTSQRITHPLEYDGNSAYRRAFVPTCATEITRFCSLWPLPLTPYGLFQLVNRYEQESKAKAAPTR